jgi:hypothetical protein
VSKKVEMFDVIAWEAREWILTYVNALRPVSCSPITRV